MRAEICFPPERIIFADGSPLQEDHIERNPYGHVGCYKIRQPVIYTCPKSKKGLTFTDKEILDWLWAHGRKDRISPLPERIVRYLDRIGDGFDFVSPGGLYVRIVAVIEEMGKMSSDWFSDLSLVIEVPNSVESRRRNRPSRN